MPIETEMTSQRSYLSVRSDKFGLNNKVAKLDKLKDILPNFSIIIVNRSKSHYLAAGQCQFKDSLFNLYIHLVEEGSWIEAVLLEGEATPMNFLLCTFKNIFGQKMK